MAIDSQSLREELYGVINHYAELADLAKKGEVNPIGQIGRIVKKSFPYLFIVIRDILPSLERDILTYNEALYQIIRECQQFNDTQTLMDSLHEMEKVEKAGRTLVYAVKWLDVKAMRKPDAQALESMQRTLIEMNKRYRERYAGPDIRTDTAMIPYSVNTPEAESRETLLDKTGDVVRRALVELHHLMMQREPEKKMYFFRSKSRDEIERDLMILARFLLRCGYSVDRIATGYHKDILSSFLNEKILDGLQESTDAIGGLTGLSSHLAQITLMDFASFFEIQSDYCTLEDSQQVQEHIKIIKNRKRRGASLLQKLYNLSKSYDDHPHGKLAAKYLNFRYNAAFGNYFGDRRQKEPRKDRALELYRSIVDQTAVDEQTESELRKSSGCFSSKTQDQMAELVRLIANSLQRPETVRGQKVKVLGDISSGAMGKVSIGIFRKMIVALKTVKSGVAQQMGNTVQLLEYEAAMHAKAQTPDEHESIVEYYGQVEQAGEKILICGYYPNDSLTHFVEQNWEAKFKPHFSEQSNLNLATLEVIVNQLLGCLRHMKKKGIIHRDLKTDNVLYLIDENERINKLKVIDFGVALDIGPDPIPDVFKGKVVGTFSYMAPEQARGRSVYQSDLFSVGAILTVVLTGKLPMVFHRTKSRQELAEQILRIEREPRPKLVKLNPWLKTHPVLEHIAATVETMLILNPADRPDVEEVQTAFDGVFHHLGHEKHHMSIFYQKD